MNWLSDKRAGFASLGALLALLIVVFSPNYGIKYAASPVLPGVVLAFMGMWLLWKERGSCLARIAQRRWLLIFGLLFVPMAISLPGSHDPRLSLGVVGASVLYLFVGIALVRALRGHTERHWLAVGILIMLAFWIGDSVVQYLFGRDLFGIELLVDGRVIGPFAENLRQATLLAVLLPVALGVLLAQRHGGWWAAAFFILAAAVAMLAGVRMVVIMFGVIFAGVYLHLPSSPWKWLAAPAMLAAAALTIFLSPVLHDRMASRMAEVQRLDFESLDKFSSQRLTIWHTAGNMLMARPLTGVGVGTFDKAYGEYSTLPDDMFRDGRARVYHTHQIYVSAAAEMGLPGLIGLLAAFILVANWYLSSSVTARQRAWPWALALMVYFFPFNTQPPLLRHWTFPILLMLLAALLAALDEPADKPEAGTI